MALFRRFFLLFFLRFNTLLEIFFPSYFLHFNWYHHHPDVIIRAMYKILSNINEVQKISPFFAFQNQYTTMIMHPGKKKRRYKKLGNNYSQRRAKTPLCLPFANLPSHPLSMLPKHISFSNRESLVILLVVILYDMGYLMIVRFSSPLFLLFFLLLLSWTGHHRWEMVPLTELMSTSASPFFFLL